MRFCQLEKTLRSIFIVFLFCGCSYLQTQWSSLWEPAPKASSTDPEVKKLAGDHEIRSDHIITPEWFDIPKKFVVYDNEKVLPVHPFFDVAANWRSDQQLINYVEISPAESSYLYDLDLPSGKIYKVRDLCGNRDLWGAYIGKIEKANFVLGIVPQYYNQENLPQKIIIFKDRYNQDRFPFIPTESREARVIGSVVLDHCDLYPCDIRKRWQPTQILVGVDVLSSNYSDIKTFAELKTRVNWPYAKAFLENQFGAHNMTSNFYPAYRVNAELEIDNTRKYFFEKSTPVNMEKTKEWRKSCLRLYNSMWDKVTEIRSAKNSQREKFFDYFKTFYTYDADKFYRCQKVFRPANINDDADRNWFFAFVQAFLHLEQNGFYYSCKNEVWSHNPRIDQYHYMTNELSELRTCGALDFEKMFDHSINGLSLMKNQRTKFFRYIEYDSDHGGSHQKIFSWIAYPTKKLACEQNSISPEIFPQDIYWQPFQIDGPKGEKIDQPYSKY